jgi:hypothetical protein
MLQDQHLVAVNWSGKGKGAKEKKARVKMAMKRVRPLPRSATPLCAFAWEISGIFFPVALFFKSRLCSQDLTTFCIRLATAILDFPLVPLIAAMFCRNRSIALAVERSR